MPEVSASYAVIRLLVVASAMWPIAVSQENRSGRNLSVAACDQCIAEVGALATIADNATAVQAWVAGLQANCSSEYPSNATARDLCDSLASAEGDAVCSGL